MTIKEIEQKYVIMKFEHNVYGLHHKDIHSLTSPHKFICVLYKSAANKFHLKDEKPTAKLSVLEEQINRYIDTLAFDSQFYNPFLRAGYNELNFIVDYMHSLGFENEYRETYVYNPKNIMGGSTMEIIISFNNVVQKGFDDKLPEKISMSYILGKSDKWINLKCDRNLSNIKNMINSVLYPIFITESVKFFKVAETIKEFQPQEYLLKELRGLDITEKKFNQILKDKLLDMAESIVV